MRFGIEVSRIERAGEEWLLETSRGALGARFVVVATGYDRVPKIPGWPGRKGFAGELLLVSCSSGCGMTLSIGASKYPIQGPIEGSAERKRARVASHQGTKIPCRAKSVLGSVSTSPSAPPSKTWIWPSSQIAALSSKIAPGITASTVVVTEHSAP